MRPLQEIVQATRKAVEGRKPLETHACHRLGLERLREQVLHGLDAIDAEASSPTRVTFVGEKRRRILFNSINALGAVHKRAHEYTHERVLSLLPRDIGLEPAAGQAVLHYEDDEFQVLDLSTYTHLKNLFGPNSLHAVRASMAIAAFRSVQLDLVGLPASEAENSLAWGLLFHEYMHKTALPASIYIHGGKTTRQAITPIWNHRGELFTDIAALLVLGPAYGYALGEAPEKFGHHGGRSHPSAALRFWVARRVLEAMTPRALSTRRGERLGRELCLRALQKLPSSESKLTKAERQFAGLARPHIGAWVRVGQSALTALNGTSWKQAVARCLSTKGNYYGWKTEEQIMADVPTLLASGILPAASPRVALNLALLGCRAGKIAPQITPAQLRSATACSFSRGSVLSASLAARESAT